MVPLKDAVTHSLELIHSLLQQIPNFQTFKGKWSLICIKLADLRAQLADSSEFSGSSASQLAQELLVAVLETLNDTVLLAKRCENLVLMDGRLKTQSDIDSVMARLDRHVTDVKVLVKSGVLHENVLGFSGSSTRKESVRAESRSLVTRLQISAGTESKNSAMDSLLCLLHEKDKNVMIAVAQGIVPVLVRLLDSSSLEMKEKAVTAISRVSAIESGKQALLVEGLFLLNHLIRVIESGSGFSKEKACVALQALSFSKENARTIGSTGGISSLLEICECGTPGSQGFASGVLRNLAAFREIKENFIEENAIFALISLVFSGTKMAQENAIGCLVNLLSEDENLMLLFIKEGGLECLKNFWDSVSYVKSFGVAVDLIKQLASCPTIAEVLASDGFIPRLVTVLNSGVLGLRIAAAKAIYKLGFSSKTQKQIGDCGCIEPLIEMLDGKAVEEKEAASMALSTLLLCSSNRKIFKKNDRGIITMVQLLDPKTLNLDKRYPVSALESVVHSKSCRKEMVAAGACVHLQKLVQMEVDGADRLSESLATSKIWGVFAKP